MRPRGKSLGACDAAVAKYLGKPLWAKTLALCIFILVKNPVPYRKAEHFLAQIAAAIFQMIGNIKNGARMVPQFTHRPVGVDHITNGIVKSLLGRSKKRVPFFLNTDMLILSRGG